MKYHNVVHARFGKRLNRFIAEVNINGMNQQVHIKNTGRLKELLKTNVDVLMERSTNPNRKTKFSLIAVEKDGRWVNIDSQAPNLVAFEALKAGKIMQVGLPDTVKREVTFGQSRFDLYFEKDDRKGFMEVKGVTLEKDGVAMFPDAPTSRGTKHVLEMIKAVQEGYIGMILFVIQMKDCRSFSPYWKMDRAFAKALQKASEEGVKILAYDSIVYEDKIVIDQPIPVYLSCLQ